VPVATEPPTAAARAVPALFTVVGGVGVLEAVTFGSPGGWGDRG